MSFANSSAASLESAPRCGAKSDNVAVRIFNVETLGAPRRYFERVEDLRAIGDTLFIEFLDAVNARCGIEVIIFSTMPALCRILRRFFQMQFESIQRADRVEPFPWLAETETQPLVVRDSAFKIVDEKLRSERSHTRFGLASHCHTFLSADLESALTGSRSYLKSRHYHS